MRRARRDAGGDAVAARDPESGRARRGAASLYLATRRRPAGLGSGAGGPAAEVAHHVTTIADVIRTPAGFGARRTPSLGAARAGLWARAAAGSSNPFRFEFDEGGGRAEAAVRDAQQCCPASPGARARTLCAVLDGELRASELPPQDPVSTATAREEASLFHRPP